MVAEPKSRGRNRAHGLPVYVTAGEVARIVAACPNERDARLVKLLWWTGGRVTEVIQIRAADVTRYGLTKLNEKQGQPVQMHVFLPAACRAELAEWARDLRPDEPLVGRLTDGKPMSRVRAWQLVTRAGRLAGVGKSRFLGDRLCAPWPHSFRHGSAVHLLENAVPISAVQAHLGHASLRSTQVYTALTDAHRQAIMESVTY